MVPVISIIVPALNEWQNIRLLYEQIVSVSFHDSFEIIFVDDGSTDGTFEEMQRLFVQDGRVRVIKLRRCFGQTAALDAGIKYAQGGILVTLDADLQNDPADIPVVVGKLREGFDCVSGWRWKRRDSLSKRLFSRLANCLRNLIVRETLHDSGCSLKAYRRECFADLTLYGEMHRYIPTILRYRGFKIGEVKVNHRMRRFGKTKYNTRRLFKGFFDLLFIKFWNDYSSRPIHFFGSVAVAQFGLAGFIFIEQVFKAIIVNGFTAGPLLILCGILLITGMLTFFFGFFFEVLIRTYYHGRGTYAVELKLMHK